MFNSEAKMMREISALKKEIQTIKDEQIKQRRDNNDAMYNLDSDNVPDLAGVVKEIRLIVKDGKVNGAFIISAINADESGAQLVASHINLDGATITLNGKKGITITSPNFEVDKQGNVTCKNATMNNATMNNATMNNAQIKKTCVLGSDISTGAGMQIGPKRTNSTDDTTTKSELFLFKDDLSEGFNLITETVANYDDSFSQHGSVTVTADGVGLSAVNNGDNTLSDIEVKPNRIALINNGNIFLEVTDTGIYYGTWNKKQTLFEA